jgi:arylsulfatase A-like enzyme
VAGRSRVGSRAFVAALAVAATLTASVAHAADPRPNVVVIETDDQTAGSLDAMPTVKRTLRDQGVTFTNSFVSYALCCPSRATFLTGQYAHNHGVFSNKPPDGGYYKLHGDSTLPVWLSAAGYRTIEVGKYLNGYGTRDPLEVPPGWTDWHGLVGWSAYHYYGFTTNDDGRLHTFAPTPRNYQTDVLMREAVNLVGRAARDRRPFFMWLTPLAPHDALDPPEPDDPPHVRTPIPAPRDRDTFADAPLPADPAFNEADVSDKPATVRGLPPLTRQAHAAITEDYRQELETLQAVDRGVGEIVAALRASGALDHTLIAFTSDNGYFHGEHRIEHGKTLPYDPALRVPLVIRGPGIPRGTTSEQQVSNQDLAPTILAATHVRPGLVQDGLSLLPLMKHRRLHPRDLLVEGLDVLADVRFAAVRTPRWFYAEYTDGESELYDLNADPDETANLAYDGRYADVVAGLAKRLAALRHCRGKGCLRRPSR